MLNLPRFIADFAARLRALPLGRRMLAAFGFGLLAALAMAPLNIFPVLWIAFPALVFLWQGSTKARQAFCIGWSFGFGFLLLGLYWIAAALFVDIKQFWWALPLAVAGLPAALALYYGLAAVLATLLSRKKGQSGLAGAIIFALCWFLADYARGHLLTGFPWNLEGYAWSGLLPMLQIASVIGIYGLTLLTLVAACLPAALIGSNRGARYAVMASLAMLLAIGIWGAWRLTQPTPIVPDIQVRLVQPNTDQAHKWQASERETHFQELLDLTSAPSTTAPTLIVWPETASTFYLTEDAARRQMIAARLAKDAIVLTGVIRRARDDKGALHYTNALVAVDDQARIAAAYDKFHLVPFGEYIPYRRWLPLPTLANMGIDFGRGDGLHSLRLGALPAFSPLICYEAIFPGEVADHADRPQFLVNVTNDGWYGNTAGPYQHFANARLRAIEEGLPLARAANTGISGMVDPYGRAIARLDLGRRGFTDSALPQPLPRTLYSRAGDKIMFLIFMIFFAAWLIMPKRL